MTKGFLIYADDSNNKRFIRSAYALAMTIKNNCPGASVSLVANSVPFEYLKVFDNVIDVPWDQKQSTMFAAEHRWKLYHCSPYDETIVMDADMLVLEDISLFWDTFKHYDVFYTTNVYDYRGNLIKDLYYRKAFDANNIPNFYSALHYFKKSDTAKEFYKMVEYINNNWELFYGKFVSIHYPKVASMDVSAGLAAKILDKEKEFSSKKTPVSFTHMKPMLQSWEIPPISWQERVGAYFNGVDLKIGNFKQDKIFHYVEDSFLSDEILTLIEQRYNNGR